MSKMIGVWDFKMNAGEGSEEGMIAGRADDRPPNPPLELPPRMRTRRMYITQSRGREIRANEGLSCKKVIGASIRRLTWQPTEMSAGKERKHWSKRTLEGADRVARTRIRFDDALAKHVQEHVALKTAKRTRHHHRVARVHN